MSCGLRMSLCDTHLCGALVTSETGQLRKRVRSSLLENAMMVVDCPIRYRKRGTWLRLLVDKQAQRADIVVANTR